MAGQVKRDGPAERTFSLRAMAQSKLMSPQKVAKGGFPANNTNIREFITRIISIDC